MELNRLPRDNDHEHPGLRQGFGEQAQQMARRFKGRSVAFGVLLSLLGIFAVIAPVVSTLGVAWALGVALFVAGIVKFAHAWQERHQASGRWSRPVLALLSVVAGLMILRSPVSGALAITLMITFYLFATAGAQFAVAFEMKPGKGWGWLMASAAVSFLLGLYLFATFPATSLVIPGLFFGVDLLFYGITLIALGMAAGRASRELRDREEDQFDRRAA